MLRKAAVILGLVVFSAATASAELKYTLRTSIRKTAQAPPANPIFAGMGELMLKQFSPNGPSDMTIVVGERGLRTEFAKEGHSVLAGCVILIDPDGSMVVLNDREKTYFRDQAENVDEALATLAELGAQPKSTHRRTGEFAMIAGVRAERIEFEWSLPLPVPDDERAKLPPDFPREISMSGDMWVTERFKKYAAFASRSNQSLAMLGMDKLMKEGLVVKSVVRSTMFGEYEVESVVTSIAEAPVPGDTFEIPIGYRKITSPRK
jgi:hypothetical protein